MTSGRSEGKASASGTAALPVRPSGYWRFGGASASTAALTVCATVASRVILPLGSHLCLFFVPGSDGWRACVEDLTSLACPTWPSLLLTQLVVFVYWRCLVSRRTPSLSGRKSGNGGTLAEASRAETSAAFFVAVYLALRMAGVASELEVAGTATAIWALWIALRMQFGRSPPLFPAIEGRRRFFRIKARIGIALADTLRTALLSAILTTLLRIVLGLSSVLFRFPPEPITLWDLFDLRGLIRPRMLQTCWLIHCAAHCAEVVATERFRYCKCLEPRGGREVTVSGMDALLGSMGEWGGGRTKDRALDMELAFLDACLLAEKSPQWRRALFTYNKGEYWYSLMRLVHSELAGLERTLIKLSTEELVKAEGVKKPRTRSALASREISHQRAFLTSRNLRSVATGIRDAQAVFSWSARVVTALAKACTKEDPLGVSQRHSKKPSLQEILVTCVSLFLFFTSLEVQLAQASGKQTGLVTIIQKIARQILCTSATIREGETESLYSNVWAMRDGLKLALYSIVKAFTCDLYSLQMESIVGTLSRASENPSGLMDDPLAEKLPLFYPLWLEEAKIGHGTRNQHAYILHQIILHNL